jgi:hypothetical protein
MSGTLVAVNLNDASQRPGGYNKVIGNHTNVILLLKTKDNEHHDLIRDLQRFVEI